MNVSKILSFCSFLISFPLLVDCTFPATRGGNGLCQCKAPYFGNVIYEGNKTSGCGRTEIIASTNVSITALQKVRVEILSDNNRSVLVSVQSAFNVAGSPIVELKFFDTNELQQDINGSQTQVAVWIPLKSESMESCENGIVNTTSLLCHARQMESESWKFDVCSTTLTMTQDTRMAICRCSVFGQVSLLFVSTTESRVSTFAVFVLTIMLVLFLAVFPLILVIAWRRDVHERNLETISEESTSKHRQLAFWEMQKQGFRARYSLWCLSRAGVLLNYVDRVFVSFLAVSILLAVCTALQAQKGSVPAVLVAAFVSSLVMFCMIQLIVAIKTPVETTDSNKRCLNRCLHPQWAWHASVVFIIVACAAYTIFASFSINCTDVLGDWVAACIVSYLIVVGILEPLKIFLFVIVSARLARWKAAGAHGIELPLIEFTEVELGKNLGQGAFGKVDQCVWRGADWAIKRLLNPAAEAEFLHEVSINSYLVAFKHSGVVGFVGLTKNPRGMMLELFPLKSVEDYVIKINHLAARSDLPNILTILIGASAGVMQLHANRVVHRDIAARNFLIRHDLTAAVCDFGLALLLPEGQEIGERLLEERKVDMLPVNTSAPETIRYGHYSPKSDVYMFGHFVWEIFARQSPHFDDADLRKRDLQSFMHRLCAGELQLVTPPDWPVEIVSLIRTCCAFDPAQRPDMEQVNDILRKFRTKVVDDSCPLPSIVARSSEPAAELDLYDSSPYQDSLYGSAYSAYGTYGASPYNVYQQVV